MSAREDLLAQLKTDIEAVNGAGDYTYTVEQVSRELLGPGDCGGAFPTVCIIPRSEPKGAPTTSQTHFRELRVDFVVMLRGGDYSVTPDQAMTGLTDDLKLALFGTQKYTHSGTALLSDFEDLEWIGEVGQGVQAAVIGVRFLYCYDRDTLS